MKSLFRIFTLATLLLWAFSSAAVSPRDPYTYFFNDTLGDFTEELETARAQGKKGIMLFFEQDECPFCHRMKTTILNQPLVQEYFRKHFLLFPIDIEGDIEITDFKGNTMRAKDYAVKVNRVRATPVIAFYDLEGHQIVKYIGATSSQQELM